MQLLGQPASLHGLNQQKLCSAFMKPRFLFPNLFLMLILATATSMTPLSGYAVTSLPPQSDLADPASDDVIRMNSGDSARRIVSEGQILEDPQAGLSLDQALASEHWATSPGGEALAFGYSLSAWWVRWQVENPAQQHQTLVFNLGQPRHDLAEWYILRDDGRQRDTMRAGDRLPVSEQPLEARNVAAPVALEPGERVEVVVRLTTYDGLFEALPVMLHTADDFDSFADTEDQVLMLFHGGVLALALYNLLLFFATRQKAFGLYTHYLFWFLAWSLTWRGYTFQYLWPGSPAFTNDFLTLAAAGTFASVGMFCVYYLRLHETAPRWVLRLIQALILANIAVAMFALSGQYLNAVVIGWATGMSLALMTLGTAVWLAFKGFRPAYFYLLAFTLLAVGVAAFILEVAAVVPTNWFTAWGIQIGSALEVLILALGLADSMNEMKAEKLEAERRERLAHQALAARLEKQVHERTRELSHANQRLQALAITDELTGAFNRRHFNEFCDKVLARELREEPLAFCMFDIDHFKPYNDMLGHVAGDQALQIICFALQDELRRSSDVLFRLGGEEFGLLFTTSSLASAREFAEHVRQLIRDQNIYHPTNEDGIVTASFGVIWCSPLSPVTRDEIYNAADELLYQAKAHGRDRVEAAEL